MRSKMQTRLIKEVDERWFEEHHGQYKIYFDNKEGINYYMRNVLKNNRKGVLKHESVN